MSQWDHTRYLLGGLDKRPGKSRENRLVGRMVRGNVNGEHSNGIEVVLETWSLRCQNCSL